MIKKANAFTIVELLIVIVVIAILAAISIVAYRGIQDRAQASSAQATASQVAKKIQVAYTENDTLPPDLGSIGISNSASTTYQYKVNTSSNTWCTTVTVGSKSYYVSSTQSSPIQGGCPGHGQGGVAAITNLIPNPSFESGTAGWSANSTAHITRTHQTTGGFSGSGFMRFTVHTAATNLSAVGTYPSGIIVQPNTAYVGTVYVRSSVPMEYRITAERRRSNNTEIGRLTDGNVMISSSWTRLTISVHPHPELERIVLTVYSGTRNWTPGETVDFDAMMLTEGTNIPAYADGHSPNWDWNGAVDNSTSTGPAL